MAISHFHPQSHPHVILLSPNGRLPFQLQPPFNTMEIRGDLLLMRTNDDGEPENFDLEEYKDWQSLVIPDWEENDDDEDDDDNVAEDGALL